MSKNIRRKYREPDNNKYIDLASKSESGIIVQKSLLNKTIINDNSTEYYFIQCFWLQKLHYISRNRCGDITRINWLLGCINDGYDSSVIFDKNSDEYKIIEKINRGSDIDEDDLFLDKNILDFIDQNSLVIEHINLRYLYSIDAIITCYYIISKMAEYNFKVDELNYIRKKLEDANIVSIDNIIDSFNWLERNIFIPDNGTNKMIFDRKLISIINEFYEIYYGTFSSTNSRFTSARRIMINYTYEMNFWTRIIPGTELEKKKEISGHFIRRCD